MSQLGMTFIDVAKILFICVLVLYVSSAKTASAVPPGCKADITLKGKTPKDITNPKSTADTTCDIKVTATNGKSIYIQAVKIELQNDEHCDQGSFKIGAEAPLCKTVPAGSIAWLIQKNEVALQFKMKTGKEKLQLTATEITAPGEQTVTLPAGNTKFTIAVPDVGTTPVSLDMTWKLKNKGGQQVSVKSVKTFPEKCDKASLKVTTLGKMTKFCEATKITKDKKLAGGPDVQIQLSAAEKVAFELEIEYYKAGWKNVDWTTIACPVGNCGQGEKSAEVTCSDPKPEAGQACIYDGTKTTSETTKVQMKKACGEECKMTDQETQHAVLLTMSITAPITKQEFDQKGLPALKTFLATAINTFCVENVGNAKICCGKEVQALETDTAKSFLDPNAGIEPASNSPYISNEKIKFYFFAKHRDTNEFCNKNPPKLRRKRNADLGKAMTQEALLKSLGGLKKNELQTTMKTAFSTTTTKPKVTIDGITEVEKKPKGGDTGSKDKTATTATTKSDSTTTTPPKKGAVDKKITTTKTTTEKSTISPTTPPNHGVPTKIDNLLICLKIFISIACWLLW